MKSAYGLEIPETIRELVNPKQCALIVYDMQIGIVRQIKDGAATTAKVNQVLDVARTAGMRVFYSSSFFAETIDGHTPISPSYVMAARG